VGIQSSDPGLLAIPSLEYDDVREPILPFLGEFK
jgi:hypothetical protein